MHTRITQIFYTTFLVLAMSSTSSANALKAGVVSFFNNDRIYVEIADTEALRAQGLMRRNHLAENSGMLFVYADQGIRGVWMKNTLLVLDVLFLSEDGKIVSMLKNLPPCQQINCRVYSSKQKARYMLEVNAGFIDRHNIQLGQTVLMDYQHEAQ